VQLPGKQNAMQLWMSLLRYIILLRLCGGHLETAQTKAYQSKATSSLPAWGASLPNSSDADCLV